MCSVSSVSRVMSERRLAWPQQWSSCRVTFALLFPSNQMGPLDTVLGLTWDGSQSAQGDSSTRSMHVQLAFDTACDGGQNDS